MAVASVAALTVALLLAEDDPAAGVVSNPRTSRWILRRDSRGPDFEHRVAARDYRLPEILAGGVAVFDADSDGRLDLYFTNSGAAPDSGAANRLYLARAGGGYDDVSDRAGCADTGFGMGVAAGDFDNDGDTDLYVANWGPDAVYLNDEGTFRRAPFVPGADAAEWSTSVTLLDFDLDGVLDVFVVGYVEFDPDHPCTGPDGELEYCGPREFPPARDTLYRGRGDGTFEDVSVRAGLAGVRAPGLGVVAADCDGDADIDIYVANDGRPNHLWINRGDGTFVDEGLARGCALNAEGASEAGMGVVHADLDSDGIGDLFVTHLENETNTLYTGGPGGVFRDVTIRTGLVAASRPRTGFGVVCGDLDHDGRLDLVVANGRVSRAANPAGASLPDHWSPYAERDQVFRNLGGGVFAAVPDAFDGDEAPARVSRGLAAADLDGDGDLDLVFVDCASRPRVYVNEIPKAGHWLRVVPVETGSGRLSNGASVRLVAAESTARGVVAAGGSYLSWMDVGPHFGLPEGTHVERIDVTWPGGPTESFACPGLDRVIVVTRGAGRVSRRSVDGE